MVFTSSIAEWQLRGWMQLCWVVKKLSMVDVMCMGVLIVTLCFSMYRQYVIVQMGTGQWLLVASEVLHYFTYYMVKGVIEYSEKLDLGNTIKDDEALNRSEMSHFYIRCNVT